MITPDNGQAALAGAPRTALAAPAPRQNTPQQQLTQAHAPQGDGRQQTGITLTNINERGAQPDRGDADFEEF